MKKKKKRNIPRSKYFNTFWIFLGVSFKNQKCPYYAEFYASRTNSHF